MERIPERILAALEAAKAAYPFKTVLKRISGRYYLYRQFGEWDSKTGRTKVTSLYLGKITSEGKFVKKTDRIGKNLERATALIEHQGGRVVWGANPSAAPARATQNIDEIDLKILQLLSNDARLPLSSMASAVWLRGGPAPTNLFLYVPWCAATPSHRGSLTLTLHGWARMIVSGQTGW